jgi:hypothetical protein
MPKDDKWPIDDARGGVFLAAGRWVCYISVPWVRMHGTSGWELPDIDCQEVRALAAVFDVLREGSAFA